MTASSHVVVDRLQKHCQARACRRPRVPLSLMSHCCRKVVAVQRHAPEVWSHTAPLRIAPSGCNRLFPADGTASIKPKACRGEASGCNGYSEVNHGRPFTRLLSANNPLRVLPCQSRNTGGRGVNDPQLRNPKGVATSRLPPRESLKMPVFCGFEDGNPSADNVATVRSFVRTRLPPGVRTICQARRNNMETISAREFARRDGCSHTLVARGIRRGSLKTDREGRPFAAQVGSGWRKSNRRAAGMPCCPTCKRPFADTGYASS